VVVLVRPPLTPVMVSLIVPVRVFDDVVIVNVDESVVGSGLNVPVVRDGSPFTLSVTLPVKPPVGVIVMV
jgi:hypothetical protein